ncbi:MULTISPECIES: quaternary ammonium compound efflux SMR transporter SugE [Rufibacter]|uniref:quaternary ammonium compound efflux SMR transporter SugE n=1 Tax=Rufibacter TaxID=1379908 RepID=UPI001B300D17|nr:MULTISPECIES: quaternary ammonium compound efflux SMR transporter SugE [Rufibacter]
MNSAWWYLVLAGLCEIGWAIGLKYTEGFSRLVPTVVTVVIMILSFVLLAQAMRTLPVGTAYASWTGIGAVGTAILGMILFNEPKDALRLVCIGLIIAGVLGLKFLAKE